MRVQMLEDQFHLDSMQRREEKRNRLVVRWNLLVAALHIFRAVADFHCMGFVVT